MRTSTTTTRTSERVIRLPKPLPHQIPVLESAARYKLIVCGRRWGKTNAGLIATVKGHGPRRCLKGAFDGGKIWWVARNYPDANEIIWPSLRRALIDGVVNSNRDISESEMRIDLPGGGSITVRSADRPDRLRGVGLDGVVMDEAAFFDPTAWSESLAPTLLDRSGWAMFISTPNGPNWFKTLFDDCPQWADWQRWQRPTSDNPLIKPDEIEKLRRKDLRIAAQEVDAQFISVKGAKFDPAYFQGDIWFDEWPPLDRIRFKVIALDPSMGKAKGDHSAFVLMALTYDGTVYVDASIDKRDSVQIVNDGMALFRQFKPIWFGSETVTFSGLLLDLFKMRAKQEQLLLPLVGINQDTKISKEDRIHTGLAPWLSNRYYRFKKNSDGARLLVSQLQAFPAKGVHDDGPDAMEMGTRLLQQLIHGAAPGARPQGPLRVTT